MEFQEVYARYKDPVWRLARRMSRTEDDALDATQEIFLRVWRGLPGFRGASKLSTWVFQVAWNCLRSRHRRSRGALHLVEVPTASTDPAEGVEVHDPAPDPERRAAAGELLEQVDAALDRLPEEQRAVIWLRDAEGLSYDEISRTLGIPIGTVRSRLARARGTLREAVERR
ncbi:MAG: sigma-70 family RNA polymerase sigma factor [Acidobacteria bacterium]|nr:sigma-70 family RNA polymerase sigma factor [Acidobacteriota bacterium]